MARKVTTPVRHSGIRTWGSWLAVGFGLLLFLTTTAAAQEFQAVPEAGGQIPVQVPEAAEPPPKEEIPELPKEILPGVLLPEQDRLPSTTLEAGPMTGVMAPYGVAPELTLPGGRAHRLGIIRVTPYLGYNAIYRTNIYQSSSNKVSDLLNLLSPGLNLELPLARHSLFLTYLGNAFLYTRNAQNNHFDHNLNAGMALKSPAGLEILTSVAYRRAVEEITSTTGEQRPYQRLTPSFQISRALADKWRLQGNYQFDMYQFSESTSYNYSNRQDHNAGLTLLYKFWPKTAVLVQYLLQRRDYPDYPLGNNLKQTPFLGLTWDPSAKLSGTVKFGYTWTAYDTAIPERNNNPGSLAMSLQVLYRYSRFTQFSLVAQRSEQNDQDYGNAGYVNTAFYLSWLKNWHYFKVNSYVTASYTRNDYNNSTNLVAANVQGKRLDNVYGVWAGLNRPLTRFLKVRLDYRYINRASNYPNVSYMEHWVGLGLQGSF